MEGIVAGITVVSAFMVTVTATSFWMRAARKAGLMGKDMNKHRKPKVPEAGGVAVIMGIAFSILVYVFFSTFVMRSDVGLFEAFALLTSLMLAAFLGFADDILGWKMGLRQWQKPLLTIPAAIPLMVINAGVSVMVLPVIGKVDFGLLFPLMVIPMGVIGASNGFNLLAGHNGLEASMGAVIFATLGGVIFWTGNYWLAVICFSAVASLLGFLVFNKFPSKIFPGDSLTYPIGTLIAVVAILGNVEKIALILFVPYIIEFVLKARKRFQAESFGVPDRHDRLGPLYKDVNSLTHVAIILPMRLFGKKPKEYDVVLELLIFELLFVLLIVATF